MDYPRLRQLVTNILNVTTNDSLVFSYDPFYTELSDFLRKECEELSLNYYEIEIESEWQELPKKLAQCLTSENYNVFILGHIKTIWHTDERKKAKYELNKRLANIVCSPKFLSVESENEDILFHKRLGETLHSILSKTKDVRIVSKSGTDLHAEINRKGRPDNKYSPFLEDGNYMVDGSGGDYPSGEVGFSPTEKSIRGKIVFDYKIQHVGVLNDPVEVILENDYIKGVNGPSDMVKEYKEYISKDPILNYISEISIGLNPYIETDNDKRFIPEEKKLSTMHFGHGGNYAYGDRVGPHFDGVIKEPTVYVDNYVIIKDGRFNSEILDPDLRKQLDEFDLLF